MDPNYAARRHNTVIIGADCLNPSPKSFASSMGTNTTETGFDLLLTDIGSGYVVNIGSTKGEELLAKYGRVREPTGEEIARQKTLRDEAAAKYKSYLDVPRERLPKLLEEAWDDIYWETKSKSCLSCGSCVMVCPTCFCFDVQDDVALNLKDGERVRQWDGCVLVDFAKVATGENFRHDKASRFRHRIYRKGKYVLEKYGRFGCVGCGRCTTACLPDIASPLEAFNALAEAARSREAPRRAAREARSCECSRAVARRARERRAREARAGCDCTSGLGREEERIACGIGGGDESAYRARGQGQAVSGCRAGVKRLEHGAQRRGSDVRCNRLI